MRIAIDAQPDVAAAAAAAAVAAGRQMSEDWIICMPIRGGCNRRFCKKHCSSKFVPVCKACASVDPWE
jgi:hypothetical protein